MLIGGPNIHPDELLNNSISCIIMIKDNENIGKLMPLGG